MKHPSGLGRPEMTSSRAERGIWRAVLMMKVAARQILHPSGLRMTSVSWRRFEV